VGLQKLTGTAASKDHWREAHRKQWVTFIGLVELRTCMEACIIWIQDERVVVEVDLGGSAQPLGYLRKFVLVNGGP
jgi:hypothetical protein